FGVSTKDAFAWWAHRSGGSRGSGGAVRLGEPARRSSRARLASEGGWERLVNDLQVAVQAHHPEIGRIVRALRAEGAGHAAMSGSGSAVFGLFERRPDGERAAAALRSPTRRAV